MDENASTEAAELVKNLNTKEAIGCTFVHEEGRHAVQQWNCVFLNKNQEILIQSPTDAKDLKRDALVNLLDFAEELRCRKAMIAIDSKAENIHELIRAYLFFGWKLVNPTVRQLKGHVLMEMLL